MQRDVETIVHLFLKEEVPDELKEDLYMEGSIILSC